jgi:hypothetical protein
MKKEKPYKDISLLDFQVTSQYSGAVLQAQAVTA